MTATATKTYTIKEVSQLFELPASTLRYYEQVGLLTNVGRKGKHRVYRDHHLGRLGAIQCFKQTGMSIKQIETFFYHEDETQDYEALVDLLTLQCEEIQRQLAELQANHQHIKTKLRYYSDKKEAREQGIAEPNWNDGL